MPMWLIVWVLTSGVIGYLYGWLICPWTDGACLTSLVAGAWAAWFYIAKNPPAAKGDLYYPAPREYKLPLKEVYTRIAEVFDQSTYNYGDKWRIVTADTEAKKIVADLRMKNKNSQQFIQTEVAFTDTSTDSTIVRFQFEAHDDNWLEFHPCSDIIEELMKKIKFQIGEGMEQQNLKEIENPEQTDRKMPVPSWWVIGLGGVCVVFLLKDIVRELLK
jgi:hypothetical protein